ncbi:MAG: hypothetical protein ACYTFI_16670, partial [Planctomycetota bacterium]
MEMPGAQDKLPSPKPRRWRRRRWLTPLAAFLAFLTVPGWYYLRYRRRQKVIAELEALGRIEWGRLRPR